MIFRYYNKEKLSASDEWSLSFGISENLLDSAFHFIQHPFELLREKKSWQHRRDPEEYELIAAFLSIATAIELLMKSKIAAKNWTLLFSNPNRATRDKLINADFQSVNFENCIKIIEDNYQIIFDQRIKSRLEKIRTVRNKVTHYFHSIGNDELLNLIAFGLDIYIEFYRSYIKGQMYDESDRTEGFEIDLVTINQFVESRIESAKQKEGKYKHLNDDLNSECQQCWTNNLIISENGEIKCLYCGDILDIEKYAEEWADSDTETSECDVCQKKTVLTRLSKQRSCIICRKLF
jgi:hypothetical protein